MRHDIYIADGKIYSDAEHTSAGFPISRLKFTYGDEVELTLHFVQNTLTEGDGLLVSMDTDLNFGEGSTPPMAEGRHTVDAADASTQTCDVTIITNTERFYSLVNGLDAPITAHLGIYVRKADISEEHYIQTELATAIVLAAPVVSLFTDTIVPLGPGDVYYTKQEVDTNFVANSQKGAANGVAELDASGYVPEGQLGKAVAAPLSGSSAPTSATAGKLGQLYVETTTPALYLCYAIDNSGATPSYGWRLVPNGDNYLPLSGGTMTGGILSTAGGYQQNIVEIPAADITYALEPGKVYKHFPSAASTYTLPDIADASATKDIAISVTFSASALSVAFVDAQGAIIPMLRTPDIAAGQTYEFECTYINGGWRIMPVSMEVEA